ncbi:MAG: hypothetical protein KAS71_14975 [Bacteroidales bacterium]|nr:hypothetical protein [Bacteroidales bacterium]
MMKTSTLFFFYNNINKENELYESKELTEPGSLFSEELNQIFNGIDYCPRKEVLEEILDKVLH